MPAQPKLYLPLFLLSLVVLPAACTLYEQETDELPTARQSDGGFHPNFEDAGPPPSHDAGFWQEDAGPWQEDAGPFDSDAGYEPDCFDATEPVCNVTNGCRALYEGVDCVCSSQGCECEAWEFDRCEP